MSVIVPNSFWYTANDIHVDNHGRTEELAQSPETLPDQNLVPRSQIWDLASNTLVVISFLLFPQPSLFFWRKPSFHQPNFLSDAELVVRGVRYGGGTVPFPSARSTVSFRWCCTGNDSGGELRLQARLFSNEFLIHYGNRSSAV